MSSPTDPQPGATGTGAPQFPPSGYQPGPGYGQPGYQPGSVPLAGPPASPSEERTMACLAHLLGVLVSWLAPLIIFLVYRDRSRFVSDQAKEALNFQITLFIGYLVSIVLMFVVVGFITFAVVWVLSLVWSIMAAVRTNRGEPYRYPVALRLIK